MWLCSFVFNCISCLTCMIVQWPMYCCNTRVSCFDIKCFRIIVKLSIASESEPQTVPLRHSDISKLVRRALLKTEYLSQPFLPQKRVSVFFILLSEPDSNQPKPKTSHKVNKIEIKVKIWPT